MRRHTFLLHPLLLLAALLVLPADSDSRAETPALRLFHLLDPADTAHMQRAAMWHDATRRNPAIEWVGVYRADPGNAAPATDLDVLVRPLSDVLRTDALPPAVAAWLLQASSHRDTEDSVLLWAASGGFAYAGTASAAEPVVLAAGLAAGLARSARTDVAVTTWGKVKELFR